MNNSNNVVFRLRLIDTKKNNISEDILNNNNLITSNILILHHGPDGNAEKNPFWNNIVIEGKEYANNNNMNVEFNGFNNDVNKMIEHLHKINEDKLYKKYDSICCTVISSQTFGELNSNKVGCEEVYNVLKDESINTLLDKLSKYVSIFTFNSLDQKVNNAVKHIGNLKIGEKILGNKAAIMIGKNTLNKFFMNHIQQFNTQLLEDAIDSSSNIIDKPRNILNSITRDIPDRIENTLVENKITEIRKNSQFKYDNLLEKNKPEEIFSYFKDVLNQINDEIIIFAAEENNIAFDHRITGIKDIFDDKKIKVIYNDVNKVIEYIDQSVHISDNDEYIIPNTQKNYSIIALQEQYLSYLKEQVDKLNKKFYNISSIGVCDIHDNIEDDTKNGNLKGASGTKPIEQINNLLLTVDNKIKKNRILGYTALPISRDINMNSKILLNELNDTSNGQLLSNDSLSKTLNIDEIYHSTQMELEDLNNEYFDNFQLLNYIQKWEAFEDTLNSDNAYTMQFKDNEKNRNFINTLVQSYIDRLNITFTNVDLDISIIPFSIDNIYRKITFNDYLDVEFVNDSIENIKNKKYSDKNIKIFKDLFERINSNTTGVMNQYNNFINSSIIKDVPFMSFINSVDLIVRAIAFIRLARRVNIKEDKTRSINSNYKKTRGLHKWWKNNVAEPVNDNVVEPINDNVVEPIENEINNEINNNNNINSQDIEDVMWNSINNFNKDTLTPAEKWMKETGKQLEKEAQDAYNDIINLVDDFFDNPCKYIIVSPNMGSKLKKTIEDELLYGNQICLTISAVSREVQIGISETIIDSTQLIDLTNTLNKTIYFKKSKNQITIPGSIPELNYKIDDPTDNGMFSEFTQLPPKKFYGVLSYFFNFGFKDCNIYCSKIQPYAIIGASVSTQADLSLTNEVGCNFLTKGLLTFTYVTKFGFETEKKHKLEIPIAEGTKMSYSAGTFRYTFPDITKHIEDAGIGINKIHNIKLNTVQFISLLDFSSLSSDDIKNLEKIMNDLEFKISFKFKPAITIQPFISCNIPENYDEPNTDQTKKVKATDIMYTGIYMDVIKFEIPKNDINVSVPDWADDLPGVSDLKKCIKDVIYNLNIDYGCLEINST
tara:strand:+ start:207 stop:3542 length:3336 start_codon:yes stop_codon:yes gene_type:complete